MKKKINIVNFDPYLYSKNLKPQWKKYGKYIEVKKNTPLDSYFKIVDIAIVRFTINFDQKTIEKCKNLKIIATNATGLNHIDQLSAKKNNIKIISLKNEKLFLKEITSTAEHTWALLLAFEKNIFQSINHVKENNWNRNMFLGRSLFSKKIGIFGFGRNGKIINKFAKAFGMKVKSLDINKVSNNLIFPNDLEIFLKDLDYLILTLPLNSLTNKIINKNILNLLHKDCVLINTSRGEIVDEKHLLMALKSNKIRGYATDVITDEFNYKKNKMIEYSKKNANVIITPHLGGASIDSWQKTEEFIHNKTIKYLEKMDLNK